MGSSSRGVLPWVKKSLIKFVSSNQANSFFSLLSLGNICQQPYGEAMFMKYLLCNTICVLSF